MGKRVVNVGAAAGPEEAEPEVIPLAAAQPISGSRKQPGCLRRFSGTGAWPQLRALAARHLAQGLAAGREVGQVRQRAARS